MSALYALLRQSGISLLRLGRWYENDPVQSILVGFNCKQRAGGERFSRFFRSFFLGTALHTIFFM